MCYVLWRSYPEQTDCYIIEQKPLIGTSRRFFPERLIGGNIQKTRNQTWTRAPAKATLGSKKPYIPQLKKKGQTRIRHTMHTKHLHNTPSPMWSPGPLSTISAEVGASWRGPRWPAHRLVTSNEQILFYTRQILITRIRFV